MLLEKDWYDDVPCFTTPGTPRGIRAAVVESLKELRKQKHVQWSYQDGGKLSVRLLSNEGGHALR